MFAKSPKEEGLTFLLHRRDTQSLQRSVCAVNEGRCAHQVQSERRRRSLCAVSVRQSYGKRVLQFFSTCQTVRAGLCMVSMCRPRGKGAHHVHAEGRGKSLSAVNVRQRKRKEVATYLIEVDSRRRKRSKLNLVSMCRRRSSSHTVGVRSGFDQAFVSSADVEAPKDRRGTQLW